MTRQEEAKILKESFLKALNDEPVVEGNVHIKVTLHP